MFIVYELSVMLLLCLARIAQDVNAVYIRRLLIVCSFCFKRVVFKEIVKIFKTALEVFCEKR